MSMNLKEDKKAYAIMGCAMRVHRILGDGFLESAYGDALEVEFARNGIPYVREDDLRVFYDGVPLKTHYRADFTCFDRQYIVELKAIKNLTRVEWAQVVHYMRATRTPYGLLLTCSTSVVRSSSTTHSTKGPSRRYSTTEEVWRKLPPDENNAAEGRQESG